MEDFLAESNVHGWPSFRDEEVVWENMRVLKTSGEAVSADGTHLYVAVGGHRNSTRTPHTLTLPTPHPTSHTLARTRAHYARLCPPPHRSCGCASCPAIG